jgi:hypothetical protein
MMSINARAAPSREKERKERDAPKERKSNNDSEDPIRAKDRRDKVAPKLDRP